MGSLNQDRPGVVSFGQVERSDFVDFANWTARTEIGGTFTQQDSSMTDKQVLKYEWSGSEHGSLIHPRNRAALAYGWEQWVHLFTRESNSFSGGGSPLGPALLLNDNGSDLAADGYYLWAGWDNSQPEVKIVQVSSVGTVFTTIKTVNYTVLSGDLLTLHLVVDTNTIPETHTLTAYCNAEFVGSVARQPGVHTAAEGHRPGIGASVNPSGFSRTVYYAGQWACNVLSF